MRAVILAAGEGSRLRPFTADKPKPMVRAANKPIMQYAVEALAANGITDITVVVGYHRERVQSYFGDGRKFGVRIDYAFQDVLGSTARALATLPAPKESFLTLSGDNVVDGGLVKSLLNAAGTGLAVVTHRSDRPDRYGVVTLDGERVRALVEKPREPSSEWVNTGVYRLTPALHEAAVLASKGVLGVPPGVPDLLQSAIASGERVEAVKTEALWSDAVYPWDLLRVHADILHATAPRAPALPSVHAEHPILVGDDTVVGPGTTLGAGTCIGDHVWIGPQCVIENCVLYDDVQIGAGSILRNTIVGTGTRIGPRFTALSGRADIHVSDGWHSLDDFGAVVGEDCRIGGAVTLLPGSTLGNEVQVAHGRLIGSMVPDKARVV